MKLLDPHHQQLALSILERSADLTLATIRADGTPHASTVSFAHDGLLLYAAIAIDSHKAHDIHLNPRVALTVNAPYRDWNEIQGLSIDATASMLDEPLESRRASELLLAKFPQYAGVVADTTSLPWPGMLFIRFAPRVVSVLDYTVRFGHLETFEVAAEV
ncbi:MAG: pyridoxamine 5'-phosphate oxidase family protein [Massilia sp.]